MFLQFLQLHNPDHAKLRLMLLILQGQPGSDSWRSAETAEPNPSIRDVERVGEFRGIRTFLG